MQTTHDKINSKQDVSYNFDNFFKISADFICIAGFDGYFKKINPTVSKVLGFTEEELYSRPLAVLYTHQISKHH
jgi:PAS domain S-box-containing protein